MQKKNFYMQAKNKQLNFEFNIKLIHLYKFRLFDLKKA